MGHFQGKTASKFGFVIRYYENLGSHFVLITYCMYIDNDFLFVRVFNIQR